MGRSKQSKWKRYVPYFLVTTTYLYEFFLSHQAIVLYAQNGAPKFGKLKVMYHLVAFVMYNTNHFSILGQSNIICSLVQNILRIEGELRNTSASARKRVSYSLQTIAVMVNYFLVALFQTVTIQIGIMTRPESQMYLSSFYGKNPPLWIKIATCIFTYGAHGTHVLGLVFNILVVAIYVHVFNNTLLYLTIKNHSCIFHPGLGCHAREEAIRYYRRLSVLQAHFNATFGKWVLGAEITLMWVVVFNIFLAIVFGTVRGTVNGVIGTIIFLQFYKMMGQTYELSKGTLGSWRKVTYRVDSPWMKRSMRACKPLAVNVGSFCYADKSLMLTILAIISSASANLILTFRYD
ncbi:unnamed protein product [Allacma fusca]|uniref:Uncharacterized protein n=1 Tax=Allacma fusca TaxID=39272 RepID=A0A8J2KZ68_9HEXA|nr:unnamed protein product [Allacma fusca]